MKKQLTQVIQAGHQLQLKSNLVKYKTTTNLPGFLDEIIENPEEPPVVSECPICKTYTYEPTKMACNHYFCSQCIEQLEEMKCPICRKVNDY